MQCFKCGMPQPTNEKAARLGALAALNRAEDERNALERGLTRTGAAKSPEDELRMAGFEEGWTAALTSMQMKLKEISIQYSEPAKTT